MNLEDYLASLKTLLKVRVCVVLGDEKLSLNNIVDKYSNKYGEIKNRETVYRALEDLVKNNIVDKHYDKDTKRICYALKIKKAVLNFVREKLEIST